MAKWAACKIGEAAPWAPKASLAAKAASCAAFLSIRSAFCLVLQRCPVLRCLRNESSRLRLHYCINVGQARGVPLGARFFYIHRFSLAAENPRAGQPPDRLLALLPGLSLIIESNFPGGILRTAFEPSVI